jgi:hypothetical protein
MIRATQENLMQKMNDPTIFEEKAEVVPKKEKPKKVLFKIEKVEKVSITQHDALSLK